ncbi:MAG: hypothetical protein KC613_23075 [Myxococcales bacterium]|nr:hypothetical protein [Myxococcales bacterium]MCB9524068.1 hypothetical protein [Myxococcales bacterium]
MLTAPLLCISLLAAPAVAPPDPAAVAAHANAAGLPDLRAVPAAATALDSAARYRTVGTVSALTGAVLSLVGLALLANVEDSGWGTGLAVTGSAGLLTGAGFLIAEQVARQDALDAYSAELAHRAGGGDGAAVRSAWLQLRF